MEALLPHVPTIVLLTFAGILTLAGAFYLSAHIDAKKHAMFLNALQWLDETIYKVILSNPNALGQLRSVSGSLLSSAQGKAFVDYVAKLITVHAGTAALPLKILGLGSPTFDEWLGNKIVIEVNGYLKREEAVLESAAMKAPLPPVPPSGVGGGVAAPSGSLSVLTAILLMLIPSISLAQTAATPAPVAKDAPAAKVTVSPTLKLDLANLATTIIENGDNVTADLPAAQKVINDFAGGVCLDKCHWKLSLGANLMGTAALGGSGQIVYAATIGPSGIASFWLKSDGTYGGNISLSQTFGVGTVTGAPRFAAEATSAGISIELSKSIYAGVAATNVCSLTLLKHMQQCAGGLSGLGALSMLQAVW